MNTENSSKIENSTNLKISNTTSLVGLCCKSMKEEINIMASNKEITQDKGDETKSAEEQFKSNNSSEFAELSFKNSNEKSDLSVTKVMHPYKNSNEQSDESSKIEAQNNCGEMPVFDEHKVQGPSNVAVPRILPPLPTPVLESRPLVMSVHLVPSLPITLFEVLAEAIEAATEKPVVVLHESRTDRPVPKEITDLAILPASDDWTNGVLLPLSFVFNHRLNKEFQPHVYGDVVLNRDRSEYIKNLMDLRGHSCALPDRWRPIGVTKLISNYLHARGESLAFFGNTLYANSQLAALKMVAGKQADVGIFEGPVFGCHRESLPGVDSLYTLASLGPLPPYKIMVHKDIPASLVDKINNYLLDLNQNTEWMEKLSPYNILGFAKNSISYYGGSETKAVAPTIRYY